MLTISAVGPGAFCILSEFEGVIGWGEDCLGEVLTHLVFVNIEGGHEIDVAYMVSPQINVHQAGHEFLLFCSLVMVNALHQRGSAVTHPDDSYIYFTHLDSSPFQQWSVSKKTR
jgi:hypothetical protein